MIAALQITFDPSGKEHATSLTRINLKDDVKICGDGFNERTVKISMDGLVYYVFRQDLSYLHAISEAINAAIASPSSYKVQ